MRRRDKTATIVACAVLVVAPFALASAPRWAACLSAALGLAATVPFLRSSRAFRPSPLLAFLAIAFALTAVQLLPLPSFLVGLVDPHKHALIAQNQAALGQDVPLFMALSMDPPGTALELAKLAGYLGFAYACTRIAITRKGRTALMTAVAAVGAAMAATALLHHLLHAQALFGLYAPRQMDPPPYMAPVLNPNHLAAFLAMTTPAAVALAASQPGSRRLLWVGAAILGAGICLLTESRAGAVALALGTATTVTLLAIQRRRGQRESERRSFSTTVAIGVVAFCGLVLLGAVTAGGVLQQLEGTQSAEISGQKGKVAAWRSAAALVGRHPLTGVGRGAFEESFTRVHDSGEVTFSNLENEYLEAVVDWGIPGAAALAVAFIFVALAASRRARSTALDAGALGGVTAIALHSVFDFSLELPGVALPAIALVALLTRTELVRASSKGRFPALHRRIMALAGLAIFVALGASPFAESARAETGADATAIQHRAESDATLARVERTFSRHPSDYLAAGQLAEVLYACRDPRAVRIINRALTLHPTHAGLHLFAARMLAHSQHPEQSLVEYSLALEHAHNVAAILHEIRARFSDPATAARGLPLDHDRLRAIAYALDRLRAHALAVAYYRRLVDHDPKDGEAWEHLSEAARIRGELALAERAARSAMDLRATPEAVLALAAALQARGRAAEGADTVRKMLKRPGTKLRPRDRTELQLALAAALEAEGRHAEAKETLITALAQQSSGSRMEARIRRLLAGVEDALGERNQAALERKRAREIEKN